MSIQSIQNTIEDVQKKVKDLARNYRFHKANNDREKAADLQHAMAQCRGKLELCQLEFRRGIAEQAANIRKGQAAHFDTLIQERTLWDAAVGYMLVRDAIYALSTINSADSVSNAYDLLDAAVKQMKNGNAKPSKKLFDLGKNKERNRFGYVTSSESVKRKEELLDGFFTELKATGNIDKCLEYAQSPEDLTAARRAAYVSGVTGTQPRTGGMSEMERMAAILNGLPDDPQEAVELTPEQIAAINSIEPPEIN